MRRLLPFLLLVMLPCRLIADTWAFKSELSASSTTCGRTRIEQIIDARQDRQFPVFSVKVYYDDELRAIYPNVRVDQFFPSDDCSHFLGLSNSGLPGTAVVLLDAKGELELLVRHLDVSLDYCSRSTTLDRTWYDSKNADVSYVWSPPNWSVKTVRLRGCRGEMLDLFSVIHQARTRKYLDYLRLQ